MDVNVTNDVKGFGAPPVTGVEVEDAVKPQVPPVSGTSEGTLAKLDDQALHGREGRNSQEKQDLDRAELEKVLEQVQSRMDSIGSKLRFGLHQHQEVEDVVVQITDKESGELIRQFPAEEMIQLQVKLNDLVGMLFDKQV